MFLPLTGTKKQRCVQLLNAVAGTGTLNYFPSSGPYNTSVKCVFVHIYLYTHIYMYIYIYPAYIIYLTYIMVIGFYLKKF